eukprot:TRINITY_DN8494_c0_g1_i1.p1 TRINITY_DN8494_c0_g1~~TRINITY_DN8494_c0_g1_i1.p1  ORF type:complete len:321 (-),score=48.97 TRINITY_DN8494_c0_g1_i1:134-1096(-)
MLSHTKHLSPFSSPSISTLPLLLSHSRYCKIVRKSFILSNQVNKRYCSTTNKNNPTKYDHSYSLDLYDESIVKWKRIAIENELNRIQKLRNNVHGTPSLDTLDPVVYKLICRMCSKPNSITVNKCTSCSFKLKPEDVARVNPNVFMDIIDGKNEVHEVVFRDSEIVIFKDKFPISKHHFDAVPTSVIPDITHLNSSHVQLLDKLFNQGVKIFEEMEIPLFRNKNIRDFVISGFSLPVSVFHLHLHLVLPPLYNLSQFKYPRFHMFNKVKRDLINHGRVISNHEENNPHRNFDKEEGDRYHEKIVINHLILMEELRRTLNE